MKEESFEANPLNKKISRRRAVSTAVAAGAVVGVGILAGVGGYLAGSATGGVRTVTDTKTVTVGAQTVTTTVTAGGTTVTRTVTQTVTGKPTVEGPPLQFVHWHYRDDIVTSYVKKFEEYFGEKVTEIHLSNENYNPLLEAKFQAGDVIDMCYANFFEAARLIELGFTRDVESFPEIKQIKAEMYPSIVEAYSTADGRLAGLTYFWSARSCPVVDDAILEKAGMGGERPGTWDELWDMARDVKKAGAAEHPVMPHWFNANYGITWDFLAEMSNVFNDPDLTKTLFNRKFEPVFDAKTEVGELLKTWQQVFKEGLVDPTVLAQAGDSDHVSAIVTGKYAFTPTALYYFKVQNDPSQSRIPKGKANLVPVTKSGWGVIDTGLYCWPKKTTDDFRSQRLIKFLGWRTPDGERLTATAWAITDALGSGYTDTLRHPDVQKAFREWLGERAPQTLKTFDDIANTMGRPFIFKSPLYTEWADISFPILSAVTAGTTSVEDGVTRLRSEADRLYKKFHGR
jgi:ABC-type glycerol-3-phosphate transport system substrate-binding protein